MAFVILLGGTESVIGQDQGPVSDASEQGLPSGLTITGIPQGQKVGRFAESDRYMLSGIQSFTTFEVFRHLQRDPAVFLARDSGASLSDLVSVMGKQLRLGYLRSGFPDVEVRVLPDQSGERILIQVTEGQRIVAGDVIITGVVPEVRQSLIEFLTTPHLNVSTTQIAWLSSKADLATIDYDRGRQDPRPYVPNLNLDTYPAFWPKGEGAPLHTPRRPRST